LGKALMRLMIDGYNLALPHGTGVATYGHQLANAAADAGIEVSGLYGLRAPFSRRLRDVMFYEALGGGGHDVRSHRRWSFGWYREVTLMIRGKRTRQIPTEGRVLTRQFEQRLPAFANLYTAPDIFELGARNFTRTGLFSNIHVPRPPDVMHWTYPLPVRVKGAANIYTMHDLVPLKLPYASADTKRYYYKLMRAIVQRADRIVTVSEASRNDIIQFFPAAERKIVNTYQAVRVPVAISEEREEDLAAAIHSIFNLPYKGYFLFFGAIEPKKNVHRLIEAYLSLATKTPLVIVGRRVWGSEEELRLLQRDELQPLKSTFKNIRRIDYLPRSLLLRLVRGAKAVAFPSIYEGFGLPVLEAMSLGTPVLTSNVSSLPEVGGDAALYVDPYQPREIMAGLRALDDDAGLRARMAEAGRDQAERFSVARYQDRLTRMYEGLLEERGVAAHDSSPSRGRAAGFEGGIVTGGNFNAGA
jgi:glycosyltransferase involved in cell wall biosynthesis